ncbi:tRNA (adenine(22)-N(1))-methyltransferase TrmK [Kaarinaea lacus]
MKRIASRRAGFSASIVFPAFLLLIGCSHNQQWEKVDHPGSYDLVKMGNKEVDGEKFRVTNVHGKTFLSYPEVHGPSFFSAYLLEHSNVQRGETVLDMGTGSGILAIFAAEYAEHVLATDISEKALENTLINARRHNLEDKITVRKSDLFNSINPDEKFDVILTNIPIPWDEKPGEVWELQERYFQQAAKHLNPGGRIYYLAISLNNVARTKMMIEENKLKIMHIDMVHVDNNDNDYELLVYHIEHMPPAPEKNLENET